MGRELANYAEILVGLILFLFGAGLNLTVIGLPAGITADLIGIILMVHGATNSKKFKL